MKKAILLSGIFALSVLSGCQTDEKNSKTAEGVEKIAEDTKEEDGKEEIKKDRKENGRNSITASLTEEPEVSVTPKPSVSVKAEKKSAPTLTPTSLPVPTLSPEEGTISKPVHAETSQNNKLIFVGDSRTEGIRDAVHDDNIWSCLSSMGYDWMVSTGIPQIEAEIEDNTSVIILMGVNDVDNLNKYVQYINEKAKEWTDLGASTYFVSVGPVENDPYVTNEQIESFNAAMEANLLGVTYIDVYSHLMETGYSTVDGTHYPEAVSVEIYNYILDNLEETTGGIWG